MRFIVDFHNNTAQADIDSYLSTNGCTILKEWDNFEKVYLVEAAVEPPVTAITAFVKNDHNLAIKPLLNVEVNQYWAQLINPNYPTATISTTDQKDWWKNYSLQSPVFDQPETSFSMKGDHIHVYIMDSGIDASHPEFEGVSITNVYTITPNDYSDNNGHGTALASVIAGKTCGITTSKLKIVKIFEPNYDTMQSELLSALDAILSDVPENHFALVNCSWIIDKNEWVEYKMREMTQRGIWILAAAGNQGTTIEDVTPASMPEVFTVGAYSPDLVPCDFSNYTGDHLNPTIGSVNSGELDGWAPGEQIWVAKPGGEYAFVGGTSIATAIMTAVAAWELNDDIRSDGTMAEFLQGVAPVGPDALVGKLASRGDILDLSDPKYQNSVNKIATFGRNAPVRPAADYFAVIAKTGMKNNLVQIYNTSLTKSFVFTTPVPENFSVMPNGLFWGQPTEAQGPAADQSFVLHTLSAIRTNLDDVEEVITIDLYIIRQNYEPTSLPEDHPVNIQLQFGQCGDIGGTWGFPYCTIYSNPPCNGNCNFACCDASPKSINCNCIG